MKQNVKRKTRQQESVSAAADEVEGGGQSYRRINLVGLGRRAGAGHEDCKEGLPEVKRMA